MKLQMIAGLCALGLSATPALSQGTPLVGFQIQDVAYPGGGLMRTLHNWDAIGFYGQTVTRYDSAGNVLQVLHTFPTSNFTGALAVDPTESFAIVGESSFGDVFRVDLSAGGAVFLTNLLYNYDAAFAPDGSVYLSAATGGFGTDNDLVRLDPLTGATTYVAHVLGASGQLSVDNAGNVFYATVSDSFPAPSGSTDVLIFTASALAGADCNVPGGCLDESDAIPFAFGFDGASDLTYDPQTGAVYMAENNFFSGLSRVWKVQSGSATSALPFVIESNGNWTGGLEVLGATGPALLQAYQPTSSARLSYTSSGARREVTARRPEVQLSGPGTSGAGLVTVDVAAAEPGGFALLFYGPTSMVAGSESVLPIANAAPLFSAMDLGTLKFGALLLLDGAGAASTSFNNPGLFGVVSIQGMVLDVNATQFLGTTMRADL